MKKCKSIFKSILWLALYGVSYFLIIFIMALIFKNGKINEFQKLFPYVNSQMIEEMFQAFLKTEKFQKEFLSFIQENLLIYTMLNFIPLILFSLKYRKIKPVKRIINKDSLIYIFILTSIFSLSLNLILSHFSYEEVPLTIWYFLLSGVIGPITEELFFRGILYDELKKSFSVKISFIILTIIFTVLHQSLGNMIYAFFMGMWFTLLFDHYQNIKIPMFAHIIGNSLVSILLPYLYIQTREVKIGFLLLLFFLFLLTFFQIKNQENKE